MVPLAELVAQRQRPVIICTTSVLGSIVQDLAGEQVEIYIVASTSACPAHYDVRPRDVELVGKADLILYHGMEAWLSKLVEASGSNATLVKISGTWNTPEGASSYYIRISEILEENLGLDTSERLMKCLESINSIARRLKKEASRRGVEGVSVICMKWQEPFVSWLGFKVVAEFGPPEKLSSKDIADLIEIGQKEGVMLVVSNLQSGIACGKYIADKIGAVHVVLTNFPDPGKGVLNLSHVFSYNSRELFDALHEYELRRELSSLERSLKTYRALTYSLGIIALVEAALLGYLLISRR